MKKNTRIAKHFFLLNRVFIYVWSDFIIHRKAEFNLQCERQSLKNRRISVERMVGNSIHWEKELKRTH